MAKREGMNSNLAMVAGRSQTKTRPDGLTAWMQRMQRMQMHFVKVRKRYICFMS